MSTIFVQREGQKWGPFTTEELEGKVVDGVFTPEDLYWTEGMEDWQPLSDVLAAPDEEEQTEEPQGGEGQPEKLEAEDVSPDDAPAPLFEIEESNILFDSPEARLTSQTLHLGGEDIPVLTVAKASVQTETIQRTRPIIGSVVVGVMIVCIAFLEIHRPNLTAWLIWGAVLLALFIWWLRLLSLAIRSASTMLIVDLRNGDERILQMEPDDARELAAGIDQAVIAALDR